MKWKKNVWSILYVAVVVYLYENFCGFICLQMYQLSKSRMQNRSSYIFHLSKNTEGQTGAIYRKEHGLPFFIACKMSGEFQNNSIY